MSVFKFFFLCQNVLGDRYTGQLEEFAKIVRGETANPYPYEHELLVHELLLDACGYAK